MQRIFENPTNNTASAVPSRPARASRRRLFSTVALLAIVLAFGTDVATAQFIRPVVTARIPVVNQIPDYARSPLIHLDRRGKLWINGFSGVDVVRIDDDIAANRTTVEHNGFTYAFRSDRVRAICANLGDGQNTFSYQPGRSTRTLTRSRSIRVIGGNSFDYVTIRLASNAAGRPVDVAAGVAVFVQTFGGQDMLEMPIRNVNERGSVAATIFLGDGGDGFTGRVEGTVAGAISWIVFGEDNPRNNPDELIVDFVDMDLEEGATAEVQLIGGDGRDYVELWHRGVVRGDSLFSLLGGNLADVSLLDEEPQPGDTVICNIGLRPGSTGVAVYEVLGGMGDDELVLQVRNQNPQRDMRRFDARLNGGPGYDFYYRTRNVSVSACEEYDRNMRQQVLE